MIFASLNSTYLLSACCSLTIIMADVVDHSTEKSNWLNNLHFIHSQVVVLLNMLLLRRRKEPSGVCTTSTLCLEYILHCQLFVKLGFFILQVIDCEPAYVRRWALFKLDMLMVKGSDMVMLGLLCGLSALFVITGFEAAITVQPVLYSTTQKSFIFVFKTSNSAPSTLVPASLRFTHTSICCLSQSTLYFVACTNKFIVFPQSW